MQPQEKLEQLLARQETLKQELKTRGKELLEAQRLRKETLKRKATENLKTEDWLNQTLDEFLDRP